MKRSLFIGAALCFGAGVAAPLILNGAKGFIGTRLDPKDFALLTKGVNFNYVSSTLLMKIFTKTVTDADRLDYMHQIVFPNRNLFVRGETNRIFGSPGFYRV